MLSITKELFQWEKGRAVHISPNHPEITRVQFYNKKSEISVENYVIDGKAQIPNSLLKESLPIVALACIKKDSEIAVISRKEFKVLGRPKPESYVDEDDPVNPDVPDIDVDIIYDGGVEV